jgi:poly(A) polymerase
LQLSLVGGAVRDQLLGHPAPLKDLDIVVEGSQPQPALLLAEAVSAASQQLPADLRLLQLQLHGAYGTARLLLAGANGELVCDLSSARGENYDFPGAHPSVYAAPLAVDLLRRDFSLNAIALPLRPGWRPNSLEGLLDPHGGIEHLRQRQLYLLHRRSLWDDPTRLVRGCRYAARLQLELAPSSAQQLAEVLAAHPWPAAAPALGARLRMELELLLEEETWGEALELMQRWGGLELLQPGWRQLSQHWLVMLQRLGRWGVGLAPDWSAAELRLVGLLALMPALAAEQLALAQQLQLSHRQQRLLEQLQGLSTWLSENAAAGQNWRPSQWTAALEHPGGAGHPLAVLLLLSLGRCGPGQRRPLLRWLLRWRHQIAPLSAGQLLAAGMQPGPALGEALRRSRAAAIDAAD